MKKHHRKWLNLILSCVFRFSAPAKATCKNWKRKGHRLEQYRIGRLLSECEVFEKNRIFPCKLECNQSFSKEWKTKPTTIRDQYSLISIFPKRINPKEGFHQHCCCYNCWRHRIWLQPEFTNEPYQIRAHSSFETGFGSKLDESMHSFQCSWGFQAYSPYFSSSHWSFFLQV